MKSGWHGLQDPCFFLSPADIQTLLYYREAIH